MPECEVLLNNHWRRDGKFQPTMLNPRFREEVNA